jgi:hypothetical protein
MVYGRASIHCLRVWKRWISWPARLNIQDKMKAQNCIVRLSGDAPNNSSLSAGTENSQLVSFSDAARFLGLDPFTFYGLIQREEIPFEFAPSGEFLVSQDDVDRLAGKEFSC